MEVKARPRYIISDRTEESNVQKGGIDRTSCSYEHGGEEKVTWIS